MFLFARLMIEELEMQDTDNERRQALEVMPAGIDDIYSRVRANIGDLRPNRQQRIHHLLQLVLCAARPVSVPEAEIALAIIPNSPNFDTKHISDVSSLVDNYCRSLIEIDPKDNCLKVIHATAREFLLSTAAGSLMIEPKLAHNRLLSILSYLLEFQ
jgi:hypothetical protein